VAGSLEPPKRKLGWARKKLFELQTAVDALVNGKPCRVVAVTDPEGHTFFFPRVVKEPDPDWEMMLGNICNDARSALDYLVRQLAIANGADPTKKKRRQFPIFLDGHEYMSGGKGKSPRDRMLVDVHENHRTIIDSYQPYQPGRGPGDPLALLHWLTNEDKHETYHPGFLLKAGSVLNFPPNQLGLSFFAIEPAPGRRGVPIRDGAHLGGVHSTAGPMYPQGEVDVTDSSTIYLNVGFSDRRIAVDDLWEVLGRVNEIIERFVL
jgi:hypothetical protein